MTTVEVTASTSAMLRVKGPSMRSCTGRNDSSPVLPTSGTSRRSPSMVCARKMAPWVIWAANAAGLAMTLLVAIAIRKTMGSGSSSANHARPLGSHPPRISCTSPSRR